MPPRNCWQASGILSWHPHACHIREEELGLTPARLRGIKESRGELLVFVDDDNVLAAEYLQYTAAIAEEFPKLGAWSGEVLPEFECPPDPATNRVLGYLCIRRLQSDYWGNWRSLDLMPYGAGMCLKRSVASAYAKTIGDSAIRRTLGRTGSNLSSCEDTDMALCSLDIGLGTGLFRKLQVTHLIPSRRLEHSYLLKLAEEMHASCIIFMRIRGMEAVQRSRIHRVAKVFLWWYRWLRAGWFAKQFLLAERRGKERGRSVAREMGL